MDYELESVCIRSALSRILIPGRSHLIPADSTHSCCRRSASSYLISRNLRVRCPQQGSAFQAHIYYSPVWVKQQLCTAPKLGCPNRKKCLSIRQACSILRLHKTILWCGMRLGIPQDLHLICTLITPSLCSHSPSHSGHTKQLSLLLSPVPLATCQ